MELRPHQELSVEFLSRDNNRLLADEQRVGKTAPALVAIRELGLRKILIICPVSVLYNWERWARLAGLNHRIGICDPNAEICIVPWSRISAGDLAALLRQHWELVIADESHYAKAFTAARTRALYGTPRGIQVDLGAAIVRRAERVWCLTGTPIPHDPSDLYPMLRVLFPDTLKAGPGWPDVTHYADFMHRYVVTRPQRVSPWRTITVKIGGRNEGELGRRLGNRMLRRKQIDIGIRPSDHDLLPLQVSAAHRRQIEVDIEMAAVLQAAQDPDVRRLERLVTARVMHLTGDIKALAVADAAKSYLEDSDDKLVIAYWHKSVGDTLERLLGKYGVLRVDGSTPANTRDQAVMAFKLPQYRIFLGQIAASGEGIDLSPAPELWFAKSVFSPRMMSQMAARISNMNQTRQTLCRVCMLAGSIDEKIAEALLRLYTSIKKVLEA